MAKNVGGRPTKYRKEFRDQLIQFFSGDKYSEFCKKRITKRDGTVEEEFEAIAADTPFLEAFARELGVSSRTLHRWATERYPDDYANEKKRGKTKHPGFCLAYNTAKQLQKEFLIDNGLKGHYPPASFIFVAKNITDMRDKAELDHTSKGETIAPLIVSEITPHVKPEDETAPSDSVDQ